MTGLVICHTNGLKRNRVFVYFNLPLFYAQSSAVGYGVACLNSRVRLCYWHYVNVPSFYPYINIVLVTIMQTTMDKQSLPPYSATLIADYILTQSDKPLTMLHVIKLTYISHGWHLAVYSGKPLISDEIEAWRYGPVIPTLYRALRSYGKETIYKLLYCGTGLHTKYIDDRKKFMEKRICEQSQQLINRVLGEYGTLTAMELSALTHQKGTPWSDYYVEGQYFTPIPNKAIREHYIKIANSRVGYKES